MVRFYRILLLFLFFPFSFLYSQQEARWTLDQCIEYALKQNSQVRKNVAAGKVTSLDFRQSGVNGLSALSVQKSHNVNTDDITLSRFAGLSGGTVPVASLEKSSVIPAGKWNNLRSGQPGTTLQHGSTSGGNERESISLKVLDAYIQILFAQEKADFIKKQSDKTADLIRISVNRPGHRNNNDQDLKKLRAQLSDEKLALESALNQVSIDKIILAKIMELPVSGEINITRPDLTHFLDNKKAPDASKIFETSIAFSPSLRTSDFSKSLQDNPGEVYNQDHLPSLSAGLSSSRTGTTEGEALNRTDLGIHPTVGVTLSIPIWQHKQLRTNSTVTRSNQDMADALRSEAKARLKREIEQTCTSIAITGPEYHADQDKYRRITESESLSEDKFIKGIAGPDDLLVNKNNLLQAANQMLKSKYNLIFSYKMLELYEGVPLSF
jgi:outer membrane protein